MSGNRIARTTTINGLVTPAFIQNGSHYFVNLQVYADGLVECWGLLDLDLFRTRLQSGWVTTGVPDGQKLDAHELGAWTVADGRWLLGPEELFDRVTGLVRMLNPRMENLHDCHGRTVEKVGGVNVSILPPVKEQPVRVDKPGSFAKRIRGGHTSVFVRVDDRCYLADLRAYADGVIELGRLPSPEVLDIAAVTDAVERGRIFSSPPAGTRIDIYELGEFTVAKELWSIEIGDILQSVPDMIDTANGRPDSVKRCRAAYEEYVADPTEHTREALRVAYEAIPSYNRRYVGDMDTKDVPIRMVLYGNQEIEHWSHRLVARAHGMQLPTITVPKPRTTKKAAAAKGKRKKAATMPIARKKPTKDRRRSRT